MDALNQSLRSFCGSAPVTDDLTVVIVRRTAIDPAGVAWLTSGPLFPPRLNAMKAIRHPVLALSPAKRALVFVAALVFGFVLWYALQRLDAPLVRPESPWGIVSLQLAHTVEASQEIIGSWDKAARDNAQSGLLLDFLFPVCYSTALTIVCFWAAALFRERGYWKTGWLASLVAWAQWPAAAFDYVENIALWVRTPRHRRRSVAANRFLLRDDQVPVGRRGPVRSRRGADRLDLSLSIAPRASTAVTVAAPIIPSQPVRPAGSISAWRRLAAALTQVPQ